jgi:vacuolar-type H+-ATPase subunit B/Vma2
MDYKMDLKQKFSGKEFQSQSSSHQSGESQGYITEKMYMLLQLYLQNNKGWNPSMDLLQAFSELKDSVLSNPAYLQ